MLDEILNDQRDEFFADIQAGDLVFLQADDGSEAGGPLSDSARIVG